jgi:hypothetical protein
MSEMSKIRQYLKPFGKSVNSINHIAVTQGEKYKGADQQSPILQENMRPDVEKYKCSVLALKHLRQ